MISHKMISLLAFIMLAILASTAFIVSLVKTDLVNKTTTVTYNVDSVATFDTTDNQNST